MSSVTRPVPIDDVRCPKCRRSVVWTVHGGVGHIGSAYCENGRQVTRLNTNKSRPCGWGGQRVVRRADNEVYSVPELSSLGLGRAEQARELFLLGYRDGLARLKVRGDNDKPEPSYMRGLEQGRAEQAARVLDQRLARRKRP